MIDSTNIDHYLTADEAVQLLGCSKRTLRRYVSQGLVGKRGRGKNTRYSGLSVMTLTKDTGSHKLDQVLSQLRVIRASQQEILARLTLLESLFMPRGGTVDLDDADIKAVKTAIYKTYGITLSYEDCSNWSDDLLRLSEGSAKSIGYTRLSKFCDYLIARSEQLQEIKSLPKNKILIERLGWFKSRLKTYASIQSSEV